MSLKAQNKTTPIGPNVSNYLSQITPADRQADYRKIYSIFMDITGWKPKIWRRLSNIDRDILKEIMQKALDIIAEKHPI